MTWISLAAVFFIVWWVMLFVSLPVGLRTQDDENNVVLGTTSSAPRGPHMLRAVVRATLLTAAVVAVFYVVTRVLGYSFDDIPRIVPDF
ncbi:DUF1467 family protein [Chelativorans xinjiangense]|uniref:DUF1467 family protein n=1 Tax=Chelativorans xinjiangense TaxID=2681485 RepID=UPI001357F3B9|nr:DUF1467 family protein [Chelativorans xinjiangense]